MTEAKESALPTNLVAADEAERERAAGTIQRNYRGHRTRNQLKGFGLDPSTRWIEAVRDAQYQHLTKPTPPIKEDAKNEREERVQSPGRRNWARATKIAQRAGADDLSPEYSDVSEESESQKLTPEQGRERHERQAAAKAARKKNAKMMGLQYFLEMVDQKHRYGSNLRKYHAHWMKLETNENFFYWLDEGDGKKLDMPECSRARLDKEQVRYLSREERFNYLVKIDAKGLLRWAKNSELVWTKDELYKDSLTGIVPIDDQTPEFKYNIPPQEQEVVLSSSSSAADEGEEEEEGEKSFKKEPERHVNEHLHRAKGLAKVEHVSAAVLFNHMIRKSMKIGHKWIFVADTSFRLYIGYKQSGAFQHSSFMHGSRITAAGQIKVKHGQLRALAPLSGHYRPPTENFSSFVHSLRDEGVDMSRVSISRSYAILIGTEMYMRNKNMLTRAEAAVAYQKDRLLHPEKVKRDEEARKDKSQSAEKERQYLEKLRLEQQKDLGKKQDGGIVSRISGRWHGLKGVKSNNTGDGGSMEGRGTPGLGAEDGVLAPEGN